MGLNAISWRRIRTLNQRLDEKFVHVVVCSHAEHWFWTGIRIDGSAAYVDTRDWSVTPEEPGDPGTTTQYLLRSRQHGDRPDLKDWLRILDERAAELEKLR